MISKPMNQERPYGEPEYYDLSEKMIHLKKQLLRQLNPEGKEQLDHLTDLYLAQLSAMAESSFTDGFCTAIDLLVDYLKHATVNQQCPPKP